MKKKTPLWENIGKISVVVIIIWTSIQIYNNFYKPKDFDSEITAQYYNYKTAPDYVNLKNDYDIFRAAIKILSEGKSSLDNIEVDSIVPKVKNLKNIKDEVRLFSTNLTSYNRLWSFKIKNTGNKVLDSLTLDIPLEGAFQYTKQNESPKSGNFKNKIFVGSLKPSYSIAINCWVENDYKIFTDDEKNYIFSHNNGSFQIELPIENKHFWNDPVFYIFIIFGIIIFGFLLLIFRYSNNTTPKQETDNNSDSSKII